ncbi:MAG: hypothetical protein EA351_05275 [Gemmatimonadales bacterium]|nr:MAG: hypothetical protein EA351_05275 [Gemmatimonadales bacterium]
MESPGPTFRGAQVQDRRESSRARNVGVALGNSLAEEEEPPPEAREIVGSVLDSEDDQWVREEIGSALEP